jgi:hypothetical protein
MNPGGMASPVLASTNRIESIEVSEIINSLGKDPSFGSLKKLLHRGDLDMGDVCYLL